MSCSHCKGSITPVVIDESLSKMITLQAKIIHAHESAIASYKEIEAMRVIMDKVKG